MRRTSERLAAGCGRGAHHGSSPEYRNLVRIQSAVARHDRVLCSVSHKQAIERVATVPRQGADAQRGGQTNSGKLALNLFVPLASKAGFPRCGNRTILVREIKFEAQI